MNPTVLCVFGTRPEAIKMAPVIKAISLCPALHLQVCVTAQHREMLDQVLDLFGIVPDFDLQIMRKDQDLFDLSSRMLEAMKPVLSKVQPDMVLVHGDTTTTMIASLAAYYARIPVGHIEAGLRTGDRYQPFPEELNRHITSVLADYHFAPTRKAKKNLMSEGIPESRITVTGNTVIDALFSVRQQVSKDERLLVGIRERFPWLMNERRKVLITGHRRENFGRGLEKISHALLVLSKKYSDVDFIYPVHMNPNVQQPVNTILGEAGNNIHLIEPLDYLTFVYFLDRCSIVLTDSGGIQEEAPSLGKPVLVLRNYTERPEAVEAGTVSLVGNDPEKIIVSVSLLLDNSIAYHSVSRIVNPYGDGFAAGRIVHALVKILNSNHAIATMPQDEFIATE